MPDAGEVVADVNELSCAKEEFLVVVPAPLLEQGVNILDSSEGPAIAPPGQEGWPEGPGWLFKESSWN